jgi:predicted RNA-binding protein with TRAM domain
MRLLSREKEGASCPISPRRRSPRNAKNKHGRGKCPVEVGKTYEMDIVEMSPRKEGIGRVKEFSIFVRNVKLGDHIAVRITKLDSVSADAEKIT